MINHLIKLSRYKDKCNIGNNWCDRTDVSQDGSVGIQDLVMVALRI